jgi:hypothetical protein
VDANIQDLFDLLKEGLPLAREALRKLKDAKVSAAVESLDTFVNNATSQLFTISAVIDEKDRQIEKLQAELDRLRRWDDFESQVIIVEIHKGKFAYRLKEPANDVEAKLRYCTKCFAEERKSILQLNENFADIYTCPTCKTELKTPSTRTPLHSVAPIS